MKEYQYLASKFLHDNVKLIMKNESLKNDFEKIISDFRSNPGMMSTSFSKEVCDYNVSDLIIVLQYYGYHLASITTKGNSCYFDVYLMKSCY